MNETQWSKWLRSITGETTERGIARKVGRSHTTVQRWIRNGVPHTIVWELVLRFHGDPVAACVVLGYVAAEEVSEFNYAAVAEYMPTVVLTEELHKRARKTYRDYPSIKLQKRTAIL